MQILYQKICPHLNGKLCADYDVIAVRPSRSRQFVAPLRFFRPLLPLPIPNNPFSLPAFSRAPAIGPLIFPEAVFPA